MVLDRPRPSDLDALGNPIPMNAQQHRTFNDKVAEYDRLNNIALSELMKACRQNVKVKNQAETGEFNTAYKLLQRLRQRYYTVDDITKAKHMLNYHALTQGESESGAEFVDRELREYLALRDMGVQVDDSIRLTKFIQQNPTNTMHKQVAQTIFTTPNMTLGRAASLFETYNPPSGPLAVPTTPTVNAVICHYCKGKDHKLSDCPRKKSVSDKKRAEKPYSSSSAQSRSAKRQQFPCEICDSMDHLSHLCPRREEVKRCLAQSSGRQNQSSNSSNRKPSVG